MRAWCAATVVRSQVVGTAADIECLHNSFDDFQRFCRGQWYDPRIVKLSLRLFVCTSMRLCVGRKGAKMRVA